MKVPQTFTITIEQAGFLAQMSSGSRSAYVRSALDAYRKGPIAQERRYRQYVAATNELQNYIWSLGPEHNEAVARIMVQAMKEESEQSSE